jgi:hypothetical protein
MALTTLCEDFLDVPLNFYAQYKIHTAINAGNEPGFVRVPCGDLHIQPRDTY